MIRGINLCGSKHLSFVYGETSDELYYFVSLDYIDRLVLLETLSVQPCLNRPSLHNSCKALLSITHNL